METRSPGTALERGEKEGGRARAVICGWLSRSWPAGSNVRVAAPARETVELPILPADGLRHLTSTGVGPGQSALQGFAVSPSIPRTSSARRNK